MGMSIWLKNSLYKASESLQVIDVLRFYFLAFCFALAMSGPLFAGDWGSENWGQMYWGSQTATAPIIPPEVGAINDEGNEFRISLESYGAGDDGWSVITGFRADCGNGQIISSTGNTLIVSKNGDGVMTCNLLAINSFGESKATRITLDRNTIINFSRIFHDQFTRLPAN